MYIQFGRAIIASETYVSLKILFCHYLLASEQSKQDTVRCNTMESLLLIIYLSVSLPKSFNFNTRTIHRPSKHLTHVPIIITDFLSAVVLSEIAHVFLLYSGGFIALKGGCT